MTNWGIASQMQVKCRQLSNQARELEQRAFPELLSMNTNSMSPDALRLWQGAQQSLREALPTQLSEQAVQTSYLTLKTSMMLAGRHPTQTTTESMIEMAHAFYRVFVEGQSTKFVNTLLSTNSPDGSRCPEIIKSPEVIATWLKHVEDYRNSPQVIGRVMESLLSGAGKAMYQFGEKTIGQHGEEISLCPFTRAGHVEEGRRMAEVLATYASDELIQPYTRGQGGVFSDVIGALVDPHAREDGDYLSPDGFNLPPPNKQATKRYAGCFFDPAKHAWIRSAGEAGVHLQYGPSGTTRASMGVIGLLMNASGRQDFFKQDIAEIMPLVVHLIMIPSKKR